MRLRTKSTAEEPANNETLADMLAGIERIDDEGYGRVLAALGRDTVPLPADVPGDTAAAYLLLCGDTSTLAAGVEVELMRLTRAYMVDVQTKRDLAELQKRLQEAEGQRRKEQVERFVAEELEFGYGAGLAIDESDMQACYADWCSRTGEAPIENIADRISGRGYRFRNWVTQIEHDVRRWRLREFIQATCDTAPPRPLVDQVFGGRASLPREQQVGAVCRRRAPAEEAHRGGCDGCVPRSPDREDYR